MNIGDLVEIHWHDAAGYTNEPLSKAVTPLGVNRGVVVKLSVKQVVLESGRYIVEEADPIGDYTAIPRGWITKVRIIEKAKEVRDGA